MRSRLDLFDAARGLDRGRSKPLEVCWYIIKCIFFLSAFPWPSKLKVFLLRLFGSKIGNGVVLKPRINIHFPWKLVVGNHSWIGEEVFILNLEPVFIGSNVCLSQRCFLCTGNHDFRDPAFAYRNLPIAVGDGAWVGAGVIVCPGVSIGDEAVASAGSVVTHSIPPNTIVSGNPANKIGIRWR